MSNRSWYDGNMSVLALMFAKYTRCDAFDMSALY